MYSAVKVNGKKLYEYAREGKEVERPSRQVTIYKLNLLDEQEDFSGENVQFSIEIACSKGTYIRTLAVQIGELLGLSCTYGFISTNNFRKLFKSTMFNTSRSATSS